MTYANRKTGAVVEFDTREHARSDNIHNQCHCRQQGSSRNYLSILVKTADAHKEYKNGRPMVRKDWDMTCNACYEDGEPDLQLLKQRDAGICHIAETG